jgi:predicted ATPase/DNA-binding CsgD family transcriptional regulator
VARPRKLPTPPTSLIGRDRERAAVGSQLRRAEVRLLTLTGAGGVGKTRLALAVAEDLLATFEDGVFFVDLAPIVDPALVASVIAGAVEVNETARKPLVASLADHLRARSVLLVLDNFEQVLAAAPLLAELLAACPALKALVTSRAALHLSGEHEFPVPPLELPDPKHPPDAEALSQYEAVTLFIQRARAAKPDFQITNASAAAVAELCARLDGLPLAIELAAARVKLLSPQALLARLRRRLDLLIGGARDRPARQQTLRGTIDWSYDLLEPDERTLFARLAVFVGGCSLEAAEAVCAEDEGRRTEDEMAKRPSSSVLRPPSVLDLVASLVDKSLLRQAEGPEGEPRFGMLETIREYAAERFEASGDADTWRRRHAEYYLALAEQAAPELVGPAQTTWLERLEREHDNLRAALGWAIERGGEALGLRLAAALGHFWAVRGHLNEGQGWLERALSRWPEAPAPARAEALGAAGHLAYIRNEYERAATLHEEGLSLRRALGDQPGVALSLHNLGRVAHYRGDLERAAALYDESLAIRRALGDQRGVALSLNSSGVLARDRRDDERARALYEESLALFRELGDTWGIGLLLNNLARVTRDQEDWEQTAALCAESLALFRDLGDRHGVAWVLSNLAIVAQRRGAWEWAARLHGAAEAIREALGSAALSLSPAERATYEASVAVTRAELDDRAFTAAMTAGRATPPEEVAGAVLAGVGPTTGIKRAEDAPPMAPPAPDRDPSPLTRREREVAALVARGLTDRQIAETLVITEGTVGVHLSNIFTKLDLHSRAQLAVWAAERGLLTSRQ